MPLSLLVLRNGWVTAPNAAPSSSRGISLALLPQIWRLPCRGKLISDFDLVLKNLHIFFSPQESLGTWYQLYLSASAATSKLYIPFHVSDHTECQACHRAHRFQLFKMVGLSGCLRLLAENNMLWAFGRLERTRNRAIDLKHDHYALACGAGTFSHVSYKPTCLCGDNMLVTGMAPRQRRRDMLATFSSCTTLCKLSVLFLNGGSSSLNGILIPTVQDYLMT